MASAAQNQIVQDIFGGGDIWNSFRFLDKIPADTLADRLAMFSHAALLIAALCCVFQLVRIKWIAFTNKGVQAMYLLVPFFFQMALVTALLQPALYSWFLRNILSGPFDNIAEVLTGIYARNFVDQMDTYMSSIAESPSSTFSLIVSALDGSMVASIFSALIFWVVAIFALVTPMLQAFCFAMLFFLGPFCIPFSLFEWTSGVFRNWLMLTLGISFWGVVGSITYMLIDAVKFVSNVSIGAQWNEAITILVYGVMAILAFVSSLGISLYLFGSSSPFGVLGSPTASLAAAVGGVGGLFSAGAGAGMLYGTASRGVGAALEGYGKTKVGQSFGGGLASKVGAGLSGHGKSVLGATATAYGLSAPGQARVAQSFAQALGANMPSGRSGSYSAGVPKRGAGGRGKGSPNPSNHANGSKAGAAGGDLNPGTTASEAGNGARTAAAAPGTSNGHGSPTTAAADSEGSQTPSSTKADAPPPTTVAEFHNRFPYLPPPTVQKALSPFVDKGKSIPPGTQIIPFKGESEFQAKKRIGNTINRGGDLVGQQDRAFLSHLVQGEVPKNARIERQANPGSDKKESFAAAALRTAQSLNNSNLKSPVKETT